MLKIKNKFMKTENLFPSFGEFLNEATKKPAEKVSNKDTVEKPKKLTPLQKEIAEHKEWLMKTLSNKKSKEYKYAVQEIMDAAQVRYAWMRGQWNYNKADKNQTDRLIAFVDEFFPEFSYLFHWTGEPPKEVTKKNLFFIGDANLKAGNLRKWYE